MPRRLLALMLVVAAIGSFLAFVLSIAGHPPYVGIGIAILPVSFVAGLALIWGAFTVLGAGTKTRE